MQTKYLILAFETIFYSESFKHGAREKYNVKFTNSTVNHIRDQLKCLKENIQSGNHNGRHVGYDPTTDDVDQLENLLSELLNRYKQHFALTAHRNPKVNLLIHQLREAETETPKELAKEALSEVLTVPKLPKQTRKQRIAAAAELKSMERALSTIHKNQSENR